MTTSAGLPFRYFQVTLHGSVQRVLEIVSAIAEEETVSLRIAVDYVTMTVGILACCML